MASGLTLATSAVDRMQHALSKVGALHHRSVKTPDLRALEM